MRLDHYRRGIQVSVAGGPFQPLPDALADAALRDWPAAARAALETSGQAVSPHCAAVRYVVAGAGGQQDLAL